MKKRLCVLLLCIACTGIMVAEENSASKEVTVMQINSLIEDGLKENQSAILAASQNLSVTEKYMIYDENKKTAGGPFVCNWLIGFGVGSFIQHDTVSGISILCGEAAGLTIAVAGAKSLNLNTMDIGLLLYSGLHIFGMIRPWVFASQYNKTLKGALGTAPMTVSFAPIISVDNQYGFACKMTL